MEEQNWIDATVDYVKNELQHAEGGHDWWHVYRVYKLAQHIAQHEQVNSLVVSLAALLHDIADSKFYDGDESIGPRKAAEFLTSIAVPQEIIDHVVLIIEHLSFKQSLHPTTSFHSKEMDVVQDADRLDAMGAIGIARTFNYGGFKNRLIYHPDIPPQQYANKEAYKQSTAPTINHFYEKLLLLKDGIKTNHAKVIAQERHSFMELYLQQFFKEWEGN
ncbi:MAG: HD domain-containing protein [Bacteroidota bacterium]|jgi:uncharacterized protein